MYFTRWNAPFRMPPFVVDPLDRRLTPQEASIIRHLSTPDAWTGANILNTEQDFYEAPTMDTDSAAHDNTSSLSPITLPPTGSSALSVSEEYLASAIRVIFVEDGYPFVNGAHLQIYRLSIIGLDSGLTAEVRTALDHSTAHTNFLSQYILPTSAQVLSELSFTSVVGWVEQFIREDFGIPDRVNSDQARLLVDFALAWGYFVRQPTVGLAWMEFSHILHWMATGRNRDEIEGAGFFGFEELSQWARVRMPVRDHVSSSLPCVSYISR